MILRANELFLIMHAFGAYFSNARNYDLSPINYDIMNVVREIQTQAAAP